MKIPQKKPLTVRVTPAGVLTIEIGIDTLAFAAECESMGSDRESGLRITNHRGFARVVARELLDEGEDGSTLVTEALDEAIGRAAESDTVDCHTVDEGE